MQRLLNRSRGLILRNRRSFSSPSCPAANIKPFLGLSRSQFRYNGPLKAAILDWSGTCADAWVIAPAFAFVKVFEEFKVPITMKEARVPMGLRKDLHIRQLTQMPEIEKRWCRVYDEKPNDEDIRNMFNRFVPIQLECLPQFASLVIDTPATVAELRQRCELKIGMTTGFQRVMVDVLLKHAKAEGFTPDVTIAGDEVTQPRPWPYMVYKNMIKLGILNVASVLKVDDTTSGIGEGLNAGAWTCGVSHTSNYMNINSYDEVQQMSMEEFERRGEESRQILLKSGAHYVIPCIGDLPAVVDDINRRLANGESP